MLAPSPCRLVACWVSFHLVSDGLKFYSDLLKSIDDFDLDIRPIPVNLQCRWPRMQTEHYEYAIITLIGCIAGMKACANNMKAQWHAKP